MPGIRSKAHFGRLRNVHRALDVENVGARIEKDEKDEKDPCTYQTPQDLKQEHSPV